MNFQDRSQSVSSLLALLRSAQDGGDDDGAQGGSGGEADPSSAPAPAAARTTSHVPSPPRPSISTAGGRNSELSALLAQLAPSFPAASSSGAGGAASSSRASGSGSAFDGPTHDLLDPFGPVTRAPPRRGSGEAEGSIEGSARRASEDSAAKGKRKADEMDDNRAEWSFTRCLPALTDLLRDDEFVKEVRKMKKDQDALERRLWARMEKLKADHAAKQAPERQIAKITRKPVSAERVAQWERDLNTALSNLFVRHVLPSLDGLEARQVARLAELGVPGLGEGKGRGEDGRARQVRVRRIVGVLEGAVEG